MYGNLHFVIDFVVLLPFLIGLCILRMTSTCQRLARYFGPQFTNQGMYVRSRMSFHHVLNVVYGLCTCMSKVNVYFNSIQFNSIWFIQTTFNNNTILDYTNMLYRYCCLREYTRIKKLVVVCIPAHNICGHNHNIRNTYCNVNIAHILNTWLGKKTK